jgi:hypothetical protein
MDVCYGVHRTLKRGRERCKKATVACTSAFVQTSLLARQASPQRQLRELQLFVETMPFPPPKRQALSQAIPHVLVNEDPGSRRITASPV